MKRILSFVSPILLSLILAGMGFAPAGQAISAPPGGAEYSVAEQPVMQEELPPGCDWKPSVLYPVAAHSEHFDESDGAPGPLKVFYPSLDPFSDRGDASMLDCGQYPLVIFLHGHREDDPDIYQRWTRLPAALARSGYVVVAPKLPGIANGYSPWGSSDLDHAKAVLAWMQNGWEHRDHLALSPGPAVVGHSYGALLGARLAPQIGASAYVGLSGGWGIWLEEQWKTLDALNVPSFFAWGGQDAVYDNIDLIPGLWDRIKTIKYKWVFLRGRHWDYLSPSELPGHPSEWGPCSLIPDLAADYTALFLSRYVPPAGAGIAGLIAPKLLPVPTAARSSLQDSFWSGHLEGLNSQPMAGEFCQDAPVVENLPQYVFDRSGDAGAPNSATPPTVALFPGVGIYNIAYRDTSGHLHELWRAAWGAGTTDLTANASAPTAIGNPFAYADTYRNTEILLYRDSGGTVRSLYWSTGDVGHDNLSGWAGAPDTAGDPVGYYDAASDTHHVIYRTSNGHLHELWWKGVAPVQYGGDLTALASAPPAVGQPSAFVGSGGTNIVIYRSADGHIRSLYWKPGTVAHAHEDLSDYAGTPPATADPVAYYTPHNYTHQIVYRGNDGRLWELYWQGVAPVVGWDITTLLGAPTAGGTPAAYYDAATNTKHVVYRSGAQLHEIVWVPGGWVRAHINLTAAYEAPLANTQNQPAAFSFQGSYTQHVTYRGTNSHIYEVILR